MTLFGSWIFLRCGQSGFLNDFLYFQDEILFRSKGCISFAAFLARPHSLLLTFSPLSGTLFSLTPFPWRESNTTRLQLLWSLKFQIYKWNFNLVNLESPTQTSSRIFLLILHLSLGPIEQPQWTTQSPWCILVTLVSNVRLKDDLLWFLALTGVHHYPLSLNLLPFPVLCLWTQDVSYCSNNLSAKLLK